MQQRPTYLANKQTSGLDSFIGGLGIAQPPRISIKDDRFTLLDETGMTLADATLSVDVVIVGVNKNASRIFYDKSKPYEQNNHEAPLCWSDNGVGPSKACSAPQAPTCAACPNSVWGSAVGLGNKPIPACSTIKKLAVLVSGHDGLFLLNVTPGSLGSFKQYIGSLAKMPASPEELVTRVKIENKELLFDAVDWVPENYMKFIETTIENDDAASIVNRYDEARDPGEFRQLSPEAWSQTAVPRQQIAPNAGLAQDPRYMPVQQSPMPPQPVQTGLAQVSAPMQLGELITPTTNPIPKTWSQTAVGQPLPILPSIVPMPSMPAGQVPAKRPPGRPPKQTPGREIPADAASGFVNARGAILANSVPQYTPTQQPTSGSTMVYHQPAQQEVLPPQQPQFSPPVSQFPPKFAGGQQPAGFGFGMQQQPSAPDLRVQGMLDNAFAPPAPQQPAAAGVDRAFNLPRRT